MQNESLSTAFIQARDHLITFEQRVNQSVTVPEWQEIALQIATFFNQIREINLETVLITVPEGCVFADRVLTPQLTQQLGFSDEEATSIVTSLARIQVVMMLILDFKNSNVNVSGVTQFSFQTLELMLGYSSLMNRLQAANLPPPLHERISNVLSRQHAPAAAENCYTLQQRVRLAQVNSLAKIDQLLTLNDPLLISDSA